MTPRIIQFILITQTLCQFALAQAPPGAQPPPAVVTVCTVEEGILTPTQESNGKVFYKEVANVATEVNGKVIEVLFEEGQHIDKGAVMVRLDYVLLESEMHAARATAEQSSTQVLLERARLERAKSLLDDEVTTPQEYDDLRFTAEVAEHRAEAAKAEVERIEREIEKKTIRAPFSGRVVDRMTEVGDWKNEGQTVAVFARDDLFDVIVNVDQDVLEFAKPGLGVEVKVGKKQFPGEIVTVVPRGDMVSELFPVKIRVEHQDWLLEGLTAVVSLPSAEMRKCPIVPRDAVIMEGNQHVVYRIKEGTPVRSVVDVVGFSGLQAGIEGDGIAPGIEVITKGHERLRPGQAVQIVRAS